MFDSYIRTNFSLFPKEPNILSRYLDYAYTGLCRLPNLLTLYTYVLHPLTLVFDTALTYQPFGLGIHFHPLGPLLDQVLQLYTKIFKIHKHIYLKLSPLPQLYIALQNTLVYKHFHQTHIYNTHPTR